MLSNNKMDKWNQGLCKMIGRSRRGSKAAPIEMEEDSKCAAVINTIINGRVVLEYI